MSRIQAVEWCKKFREGREVVSNVDNQTVVTDKNVKIARSVETWLWAGSPGFNSCQWQ
jgi:hypothetical protein